jgi:outer membrane protein OmpA-like peptidoglycan-associated protein
MESATMHKSRTIFLLTIGLAMLAGCGGTVPFEGKSAIAITGAPPPRIKKVLPGMGRVKVTANAIEITEKIQFAVDSPVILQDSFSLLDEIAKVMNDHPELKRIAIEGHASAEGEANHNRTLSDARAKSVMTYLTTKGGVDASRLTAQGFGSDKPLADNNTEEGRVKNRRVEFNIVERGDAPKK